MKFTRRSLLVACAACTVIATAAAQDPGKKKQPPKKRDATASELFYRDFDLPIDNVRTKLGPKGPPLTATPKPIGYGTYLGLSYRIQKQTGAEWVDVPGNTAFHTGDTIRISFEANSIGYLYIITEGSDGAWDVQFPSKALGADNQVAFKRPIEIEFGIVAPAGAERVVAIVGRQPISDMDREIYALKGGGADRHARQPQSNPELLSNGGRVSGSVVGRVVSESKRNLVAQAVVPATSAARKEYAVYIANTIANSDDSRVVADFRLVHQ